MRRTIGILFAASLLTIGLAACAPSADAPDASAESTSQQTDAATQAPDDTTPADRADDLCASGEAQGGNVCVVNGGEVDGDLSFEGYEVVKLIDVTMNGSVAAGGIREMIVTGSSVDADLTITRTQAVVVKLSQIGGSLDISDAQHATLVQNQVGGDLTCDGVRADGDGNQVAGTDSCPVR
jgi:hypothetical protein